MIATISRANAMIDPPARLTAQAMTATLLLPFFRRGSWKLCNFIEKIDDIDSSDCRVVLPEHEHWGIA